MSKISGSRKKIGLWRTALVISLALSGGCRFGNSHPHPKEPEQAPKAEQAPKTVSPVSTTEELFLRYESKQAEELPRGVQALLKSSPSLAPKPKPEAKAIPKAKPSPHPLGHPKPNHPLKKSLVEELAAADSSLDPRKAPAVSPSPAQIASQKLPKPVPTTASGGYGDTPSLGRSKNTGKKTVSKPKTAKKNAPKEKSGISSKRQSAEGASEEATVASSPSVSSSTNEKAEANVHSRARLKDAAGTQSGLFSQFFSGSSNSLIAELAVLVLLVALFFVALRMRLERDFGKKRKAD